MSSKLFIILMAFLAGCAASPNVSESKLDTLLSDCTSTKAKMLGNPTNDISEVDRRSMLEATTIWATKNGYFPCEMEMCAALYNHSSKSVSAYVTYADTDHGIIGPEAVVKFSLPSFRVIDQGFWHSGCAVLHDK